MRHCARALFISIVIAGCGRPSPTASKTEGKMPASEPVPIERQEPVSKDHAVKLARDYLRNTHPEIVLADKPATVEYFVKSAVDGKPLWVVGFAVAVPKDAGGVRPFFTQAVWVR